MATPSDSEPEEAPDELTGTVVRGAGFAGIGFVLHQALTLLAYLVLARLATPSDFGEFAAAAIVVTTGLMFTDSGMLAALIHRKDRIDEAASTAVVATAIAGLLFSLLALALSPLIGIIFDSDRIAALSATLSGLLLLRSLPIVPEALLQRRFSFLRRMVVEPAQAIAFGIAAIIATSNGLGAWGLVIGFYASAVTDVLLSWVLVKWRPRIGLVSFSMWRELIGYGRHILFSGIVLRARQEVPTVLLGAFVNTSALGQFQYAQRVSSTPFSLLLSAAAFVVFPAFARISEQPERFRSAFFRSLRTFATLAFLMGCMLVAFGLSTVVLVFGDVWYAAGEATMVLGLATIASSLGALAAEALKAGGRPDVLVPAYVVAGVAGTAAMIVLLPFGLVGVSIGVVIGAAAGSLFQFFKLQRIFELALGEMLTQVWPAALAAAAMTVVMLPVDRFLIDPASHSTLPGLALLAGEAIIAIAIYVGVLAALAPSTYRETVDALARARKRRRN